MALMLYLYIVIGLMWIKPVIFCTWGFHQIRTGAKVRESSGTDRLQWKQKERNKVDLTRQKKPHAVLQCVSAHRESHAEKNIETDREVVIRS